ncbi:MAG: preprotein translocase subunit SecG [Crocinitomicaceae bacterium]|nr:preprotein translocase subunit SecG [Crocinitomicaceae bacterium]|tara:strand:- start:3533 stop:3856 length:324 start_codon:yes stop_codon:yes gene_type:complete
MLTVIFILIFLDCILLTAVVLVQESKGGGLASGFSSTTQVIGVKRTADFLEKATWGLAIGLLVLCLGAAAVGDKTENVEVEKKSSIEEYIENETILPPPEAAPTPAQ